MLGGRTETDELTEAERNQLTVLDSLIKLRSVEGDARRLRGWARTPPAQALSDQVLKELKKADAELKEAKDIFNKEMKAMEQAFKN